MKKITLIIFVFALAFGVQSCKKVEMPTVVTKDATNVEYATATINAEVTGDGNADVTDRGFVYSTIEDLSVGQPGVTKTQTGSGTGAFSLDLSTLSPNTTYYFKAYAENEEGLVYGSKLSFTTK